MTPEQQVQRAPTRIEGGSVVCTYCNRVLTFNFMERPAADCDCRALLAEYRSEEEKP